MPVTNYYTVNGEIIGEQTTGQERIDYLTDPLGNVTATIDQNAKVLNRYTYKPFGEVLSKEGTAPDPKFLWVGAHGYRSTGLKYAEVYVRRRHYSTELGRWTSRDPLRFVRLTKPYIYAICSPATFIDPSGLRACLQDDHEACCTRLRRQVITGAQSHCMKGDGTPGQWVQCSPPSPADRNLIRFACLRKGDPITDCEILRRAIDTAARYCARMCHSESPGYSPSDQWDRLALCCPETHLFCGYMCCERGDNPPNACVDYCLWEHEIDHSLNCRDIGTPRSECRAYALQMECLLKFLEARQCGLDLGTGLSIGLCCALAQRQGINVCIVRTH